MQTVIRAVCTHAQDLFACDRCTFFVLDRLSGELLGWYQDGGSLARVRVPKAGIVGQVIDSGEALNVTDASSDKQNDPSCLATGYTEPLRTVLCCPIKSRNARVVAVILCVNKRGGTVFGENDELTFSLVSKVVADLVEVNGWAAAEEAMMERKDIQDDIKGVYVQYTTETEQKGQRKAPRRPHILRETRRLSVGCDFEMPTFEREAENPNEVPLHDLTNFYRRKLLQWDFDHYDLDGELLLKLVPVSFEVLCDLQDFDMRHSDLDSFATQICQGYKSNPYHNWSHAFATLHVLLLVMAPIHLAGADSDEPKAELPDLDRIALMIAAIGHDVGHRGANNSFETSTMSDLALRYNDIQVLENHHASVTCACMKNSHLLSHMSSEAARRIRAVCIHSILGTDMAKHKDHVVWLDNNQIDTLVLDKEKGPDASPAALGLYGALLHLADLSHPCKPWRVHKRLSLSIATEFFDQYTQEDRLGLPTLPFMGKDPQRPLQELAPLQTGFLNFVIVPLWTSFDTFTGKKLSSVIQNMEANKTYWKRVEAGEELSDEQPFQMVSYIPMAHEHNSK